MSSTPPATTATVAFLRLADFVRHVFFGDLFAAVFLSVISQSAVSAWREGVGLPRWEDTSVWASEIGLDAVRIAFDAERLTQASEVETSCFFVDTTFKFGYRQFIDESHLALNPVAERFNC